MIRINCDNQEQGEEILGLVVDTTVKYHSKEYRLAPSLFKNISVIRMHEYPDNNQVPRYVIFLLTSREEPYYGSEKSITYEMTFENDDPKFVRSNSTNQ